MGWLVGLLADWAELSWVDRRVFRSEGVDGCLDHMRCTPSTLVLLWYIPWYIQTKKRTIERGSYCLISRPFYAHLIQCDRIVDPEKTSGNVAVYTIHYV